MHTNWPINLIMRSRNGGGGDTARWGLFLGFGALKVKGEGMEFLSIVRS